MKFSMRLVVAHHDEDLGWLKKVDKRWTKSVVTKGKQVPNTGRESSSYLYAMEHICYEDDGWVCFVQGNPFDHCQDALAILNGPTEYPMQFVPLGDSQLHIAQDVGTLYTGVPTKAMFGRFIGPWRGSDFAFVPGAQFVVPAAYIRGHTKDELRELREYVDTHENAAHAMERLWQQWMVF